MSLQQEQLIFLKSVKYLAIAFSVLALVGIATLMFIARDKNEDITGIVAPALLGATISAGVAIVIALVQKRWAGRDGGKAGFDHEA